VPSHLRKYEFIDALRGYAILGVLMVHSAQFVGPSHAFLRSVMAQGSLGVQLFYIASALTLCLSWRFRSAQEGHPTRDFYIRRFFRIAPMFYLAIVLYVLLNGFAPSYWAPNGIKWWFVVLTACFMHGFNPETIDSVVPGGWSIAVEMSFYAVFPLLMTYIKSIKSALVFLALSLMIWQVSLPIYHQIYANHYPADQQYLVSSFLFQNFFGQLPVFAIGILACFIFENKAALKRRVIILDAAFALLCVVQLIALRTRWTTLFMAHYIVFSGVFALFALNLALFPVKVLVNRFIALIGEISFSMYLVHVAVIYLLASIGLTAWFKRGDLSSALFYLIVVAASALISRLTYAQVESRGIALGKRIIKKYDPPST
jgi:peptidoglycan/LPS O-acetylase OafA/YrhL